MLLFTSSAIFFPAPTKLFAMQIIPVTPPKKICYWCLVKPVENESFCSSIFSFTCRHSAEGIYVTYRISKYLVFKQLFMVVFCSYLVYHYFRSIASAPDRTKGEYRLDIVYLVVSFSTTLVLMLYPFSMKAHTRLIELFQYILNTFNESDILFITEEELNSLRRFYRITGHILRGRSFLVTASFLLLLLAKKGPILLLIATYIIPYSILLSASVLIMGVIRTINLINANAIRNLKKVLAETLRKDFSRLENRKLREKLKNFARLYHRSVTCLRLLTSYNSVTGTIALTLMIWIVVMWCSLFLGILFDDRMIVPRWIIVIANITVGWVMFCIFGLFVMIDNIAQPVSFIL